MNRRVVAFILLLIVIFTSSTSGAIVQAANGIDEIKQEQTITITEVNKDDVSDNLELLVWYAAEGGKLIDLSKRKDYIGVYYDYKNEKIAIMRTNDGLDGNNEPELGSKKSRVTNVGYLTKKEQLSWFGFTSSYPTVVFKKGRDKIEYSLAKSSHLKDSVDAILIENMNKALTNISQRDSGKIDKSVAYAIEIILRYMGNKIPSSKELSNKLNKVGSSVTILNNKLNKKWEIVATRKEDSVKLQLKYNSSKKKLEDMPGLNKLVNIYNKEGLPIAGCTVFNTLASVIQDFTKEVFKENQEEADKDANEITDVTTTSFNEMSAHDKWATMIIDYIQTKGDGSKSKLSDITRSVYNVNNFKTYADSSKDNSKSGDSNTLNEEEILRLKAFAYIAITKSGDNLSIPTGFAYPTEKYKKIIINKSGRESTTIKEAANEVSSKYKDLEEIVTSPQLIASSFDSIAKYLGARLTGYKKGNPFTVKDEENESILKSSKYLDSVIPDIDTTTMPLYYPVKLKGMEKLQYIAGSKSAYEAYLDMQHILLLLASYAQYNAYLEPIDETDESKGYKNTKLDTFIEENAANASSVDISTDIKKIISAYTGIYRGLKYLDVKPFTPQLKKICEYYNSITNFEENPALKKYDPTALAGEPMREFFSIDQRKFSYYYNTGVSLSSTYIPMQTNLYDVNSLSALEDTSFVERFHYPFGFYRKALYIDTNVKSAVDYYVTGKKGSQRIATLRDMLEPEKDIMLYLDDNFYNVKDIAELQGYTYRKMANTEKAGDEATSSVKEWITDLWSDWNDVDIETVVKTGSKDNYSSNLKKKVSEYGSDKDEGSDYILSDQNIDKYLKGYTENAEKEEVFNEYTSLQSFAVVSSIYRQSALYNLITKQAGLQEPVFVSSPNLAGVKGIGLEEWNTIYNYAMLKNLEGNMGIDYKTTLDLDSTLYMDIYGNILTESGLVVIPATSNATLYKSTSYSIYTAGFLSLYDNGYSIPKEFTNSKKFLENKKVFAIDETTQTWQVRNATIGSLYINFRDLPVSDENVLHTFVELQNKLLNGNAVKFDQRVYLITEVLRGAPIESISKETEGLKGITDINKYGIYLAYKLEELSKQLLSNSNGNSMITLPNLAYMEGVEYVIVFLFKLIFAATIFLLIIKVYMDAISGALGVKTFIKFVTTLVLFVVITFAIPKLLDFSYYQSNKRLLQDEAEYIALLNLEKQSEGREIGVYNVKAPETETTLYIKIDDLTIPWYEVLDDVLLSETFQTMKGIYDEAFTTNLMSELPGIEKKSNGLYMDVNYLFETSRVEYDSENNYIYQRVKETPYASYATPYYVIMDQLLSRINEYNIENEIKSYTTKTQYGGAVRTAGMIEPYLTSDYFMKNSQDVLGFKKLYGQETTLIESNPFKKADIKRMKESLWFVDNSIMSDERIEKKTEKLDREARQFVAKNRDLLGKVTDETFLKVMALSLSIKHNDVFGINSASAIEIFDVDSRDIIRLSVAPRKVTMVDSSKSFSRFIYDNAGTLGIVSTAFLIVIYFVSSIVKPVCMFIILGCMIGSLIFRKLIKRDENKAFEGFLISLAILCGTNVIYSLLLKLSMSLQKFDITITVAIVLQIIIQIGYFLLMSMVTMGVLLDWKNFGFNRYSEYVGKFNSLKSYAEHFKVSNLSVERYNEQGYKYYERSYHNFYDNKRRTKGLTGSNYYQRMKDRDDKRGNNKM